MTECYFAPLKDTTSATICANCGQEKMLHTIGEGINATKTIIITSEDYDDDENEFIPCSGCDGHPACEDFGCAIEHGLGNMVKSKPDWEW